MNAKEGSSTRPGALGRGLDTLMGDEEERTAHDASPQAPQPQRSQDDARETNGLAPRQEDPDRDRALERNAGLVGGLIASGAAGAIVVATFSLLGVRAVLAMARGMRK